MIYIGIGYLLFWYGVSKLVKRYADKKEREWQESLAKSINEIN